MKREVSFAELMCKLLLMGRPPRLIRGQTECLTHSGAWLDVGLAINLKRSFGHRMCNVKTEGIIKNVTQTTEVFDIDKRTMRLKVG